MPLPRHWREDQSQLLVRVAEQSLLGDDAAVLRGEHGPPRQLVQAHLVGSEPIGVGVLRRQLGLDLLVLDQAALSRVDQEHAARLEAPLAHDPIRRDVEHPDLARQHHQPVVGHPVARRPKPVAVEHRAHHGAVGEGDGGRTVPRLHQGGVVAVEGASFFVHRGVVLPRLGDHHEHRVWEGAAPEVHQLEHFVEAGRVARPRRAHRVDPGEVAGDQRGLEQRLPGPHPVSVAGQRVDLPVVGQVPVRVREGPAGEGVGGEAGVDQREARLEGGVAKVAEELSELLGGEHAFVDEGACREGREVEAVDCALRPLAQHERPAFQRHQVAGRTSRGCEEHLLDPGHGAQGGLPQPGWLRRHDAPSEHPEALLGCQLLDRRPCLEGIVPVDGQEGQSRGVAPDLR